MRYTCVAVTQLADSVAYFRLPGDSVNCASNIVLNGELHLDVVEPGTYLIITTEFGTVSGNFTKIVSNVKSEVVITRRNVTIITTGPGAPLFSTVAIAIMVGSIFLFCVLVVLVWYLRRKSQVPVTVKNPIRFDL